MPPFWDMPPEEATCVAVQCHSSALTSPLGNGHAGTKQQLLLTWHSIMAAEHQPSTPPDSSAA